MSVVNRDKENILEHSLLLSLLEYNPDTGYFIWRVARGPHKQGARAGNLQPNGYRQIRINNKLYLEHRLAWFYCFKEWPNILDHDNRNSQDNRLDNLKDGTQADNTYNIGISSHNTSGYKGVSFNKSRNKYEAYISIDNKKKNLGLFSTAQEASNAYTAAVLKIRGKIYD